MKHKKLLVGAMIVGLVGSANSMSFSNTYFFGDSLTDSGAFAGNPDAGAGETFSTDPGLVWSELLANSFSSTAIANNPNNINTSVTGTNYAQGGAQVTSPIGIGQSISPSLALSVSTQLSNYLISNPIADSNALYSIWAGANDVFFNSIQVGGGLPIGAAIANLSISANELSSLVSQLAKAGAKYIIVPNLPNIGTTPSSVLSAISAAGAGNSGLSAALTIAVGVLAQPANLPAEQVAIQLQALAAAEIALGFPPNSLTAVLAQVAGLSTGLTDSYNSALAAALASNSANVIGIDVNTFLSEALANPLGFGLLNVTGVACGTPSALPCTGTSLIAPGVENVFLFADGVHPTSFGHQIIAQYIGSVLEAPILVSSLVEIPFGIVNTHHDNVFRQARIMNDNLALGEWKFFVDAGYSRQDINATRQTWSSDSKDNYLMLGLSKKVSPNWLLGAVLQQTKSSVGFDGDRGGFKLDDTRFSLFADYQKNNWFAQVIATVALRTDFNNIERKIVLGRGQRIERGKTDGEGFAVKLSGGLNVLSKQNIHAGPFASLHYQTIDVNGYAEDGMRSTAIEFGGQSRDSLLVELGAFVDAKVSDKFILRASLSREQELKDDNRSLTSGLKTLVGRSFVYDDINVDGGAWKAEVGVNMQLNKNTSVGFSYQLRKGDDIASSQSANAVFQVKF